MTIQEFVKAVQNYYNHVYAEGQRPYVAQYLRGKSPEYLDALFSVLLLRYSGQYKTVPDIAVFESLKEEARGALQSRQKALPAPEQAELSQGEIDEIFAEVRKAVGKE